MKLLRFLPWSFISMNSFSFPFFTCYCFPVWFVFGEISHFKMTKIMSKLVSITCLQHGLSCRSVILYNQIDRFCDSCFVIYWSLCSAKLDFIIHNKKPNPQVSFSLLLQLWFCFIVVYLSIWWKQNLSWGEKYPPYIVFLFLIPFWLPNLILKTFTRLSWYWHKFALFNLDLRRHFRRGRDGRPR